MFYKYFSWAIVCLLTLSWLWVFWLAEFYNIYALKCIHLFLGQLEFLLFVCFIKKELFSLCFWDGWGFNAHKKKKSVESICQYCTSFPLDFFFFVLTISSARSKVPENTNIRGLIKDLWRLHEDVNWCLNTSCSSETNDYFVSWMNQNEKLGL